MTTIDITIRRRIEVPDELLVFNEWFTDKGIERIEAPQSVAGMVPHDYQLVEAYVVGEIVLAPDPHEQADYEISIKDHAAAKKDRDNKLLAGVSPSELPTDEELVNDYFVEPPVPVPACSRCGCTEFRYDEDAACYNTMHEADAEAGVIRFNGGGHYSEGTGYPGLVCDTCGTMLDTDLEIDFNC